MRLSDKGLALVKKSEGFRADVYLDQAGLPTVGYGHLLTPGDLESHRFEKPLSEFEAESLLRLDVAFAEKAVTALVKVPLSQGQFDALVDFTFNLGRGALTGSTLLKRLNSGDYDVANEFMKWVKVRNPVTKKLETYYGLVRRRAREAELWRSCK